MSPTAGRRTRPRASGRPRRRTAARPPGRSALVVVVGPRRHRRGRPRVRGGRRRPVEPAGRRAGGGALSGPRRPVRGRATAASTTPRRRARPCGRRGPGASPSRARWPGRPDVTVDHGRGRAHVLRLAGRARRRRGDGRAPGQPAGDRRPACRRPPAGGAPLRPARRRRATSTRCCSSGPWSRPRSSASCPRWRLPGSGRSRGPLRYDALRCRGPERVSSRSDPVPSVQQRPPCTPADPRSPRRRDGARRGRRTNPGEEPPPCPS